MVQSTLVSPIIFYGVPALFWICVKRLHCFYIYIYFLRNWTFFCCILGTETWRVKSWFAEPVHSVTLCVVIAKLPKRWNPLVERFFVLDEWYEEVTYSQDMRVGSGSSFLPSPSSLSRHRHCEIFLKLFYVFLAPPNCILQNRVPHAIAMLYPQRDLEKSTWCNYLPHLLLLLIQPRALIDTTILPSVLFAILDLIFNVLRSSIVFWTEFWVENVTELLPVTFYHTISAERCWTTS